jgi:predicted metal-binding membrane protein
VLGILLVTFGIWVRLIALYASAQMVVVVVASFVSGYVALIAGLRFFRATGLVCLSASAMQFAHYYLHGSSNLNADVVSGIVFTAAGIWQFREFSKAQQADQLTSLRLTPDRLNSAAER